MTPAQNLEWFLRTSFTTPQLLRWVEGIADEPIVDELPGGTSSHAAIAHAVVKELRNRGIPAETIFTSLARERPHHAEQIAGIRRHWPASAIPAATRKRAPRILTAGAMLGVLALIPAWSWLTAVTPEPLSLAPLDPVALSSPVASSIVVIPLATRPPSAPPPVDPQATPAPLRMALQSCQGPGCNKAQSVDKLRFCNLTTIVLELTALQTTHVLFINLSNNRWSIAETRLDLQLQPSLPASTRIEVYTTSADKALVPETIVALAFRDAAMRRAYRKRFGAKRPGPELPTPAAIGMPDTPWEEARLDYEIDPSCP